MKSRQLWRGAVLAVVSAAIIGMAAANSGQFPQAGQYDRSPQGQAAGGSNSTRKTEIIELCNTQADDMQSKVARLRTFELESYKTSGRKSAMLELLEQAIITADRVANNLVVDLPTELSDRFKLLITELDSEPIRIEIKISIYEIDFSGDGEATRALLFGEGLAPANATGRAASLTADKCSKLFRALENHKRLRVLCSQTVITTDNQSARALIMEQFAKYSATGIPTVTTTVNLKYTGTQVRITPKFNADSSVTMRIVPDVSTVVLTPTQATASLLGPTFNTETIDVTATVMNGESAIIGGIVAKWEEIDEHKTAFLGDLPLVGAAFRQRTVHQKEFELLVIATPRVISNTPAAVLCAPTGAAK